MLTLFFSKTILQIYLQKLIIHIAVLWWNIITFHQGKLNVITKHPI